MTCGKNEVYNECGSACPATCSNLGKPQICTMQCVPGCYCERGMVRDDRGECVDVQECRRNPNPSPACQQEKVVGRCRAGHRRYYFDQETGQCEMFLYGGCGGNQNNFKTKEMCEATCTTKPTTPSCDDDEQYYECVPNCRNTCATYNRTNAACPFICMPGCFCKEGMVKNEDGECVPTSECDTSTETCGKNEEYNECGSACPDTCSNLGKPQFCTMQCVPGCNCKRGMVRNDKGECVDPQECQQKPTTPPCEDDEQYYECVPNCRNTCATYNRTDGACPFICMPGCFCKEGMVKNEDGECVTTSECDAESEEECDEDEEYYKDCTPQCSATCEAYNNPGCQAPTALPPAECGPDEQYYECTPSCKNNCKTYNNPGVRCACGPPGCFCKEGLVKREDGKCVPPNQCDDTGNSSEECGDDEEYYDCAPSCGGTCETYNNTATILCLPCGPGCWCSKGLVKRKDGRCVPPQECNVQPTNECPGVNEEVVPCAKPKFCNTCGIRGNCKLRSCEKGCDCKPGYYRDDNGTCIPESQCPGSTKQCPGVNEEMVPCAKPKSCNTCGIRGNCKLKKCDQGCDCKPGYYRDDNGTCIPESQCPGSTKLCPGVNEEVVPCAKPKSCNTCGIRGNCKLKKCDEGCDCKPGYYRDDNGTCIPESQCPRSKKLPCPENQTYYDCMPSCKRTCMTYNSTVACSTTECLKGCFCKGDHLVMSKNGECIPPEECPVSCPLNQMYYECMPKCQNRCQPPDVCTADCRSGCFCKEGLLMRDDGRCVRKEVCDQSICGPDEECDSGESEEESIEVITRESETSSITYSTSGSTKRFAFMPHILQTTTTTTESKTSGEEPGENPKPTSGGGACGKNEEHKDCGSGCVPTCSDAGIPLICDLHPLQCFPGCYCVEGMVRNDQGECVSPQECNQKTCGKNEEYKECGSACAPTCSNPGNPLICILPCVSGCFCIDGMVKNDQGECVNPQECNQNGEREEESNEVITIESETSSNTYSTSGSTKEITTITTESKTSDEEPGQIPIPKSGGGVANSTYYYPNTLSFHRDMRKNEEYKECGSACAPTCSNPGNPLICILPCVSGCFCIGGMVKNDQGECVSPQECNQSEKCFHIQT
ncbi:hypothetical protein CEXT_538132 [Caerostris extrusa]|uniref:BPTI/Kunitz inhibitor domain-containing protein n=1 Tax=Caerostris extrusa TaxID=172846 RepID=A0AAV4Q3T4_CAEEX|nr:hypothetical protein CEXT_538132 [Caerostris extrusa]